MRQLDYSGLIHGKTSYPAESKTDDEGAGHSAERVFPNPGAGIIQQAFTSCAQDAGGRRTDLGNALPQPAYLGAESSSSSSGDTLADTRS